MPGIAREFPGKCPGIPGKTREFVPIIQIHVFFLFCNISRTIALLFSASTFFTSNSEVSKINFPGVFLRKWLYRRGFVEESPLQGSSKDRRPKGDDVEYSPSSDDERWEKVSKKPGNESLEPRRISVPLPGSEAQALTPAYRKMIKRLDDKVELYKLHVKHYHMSPTQFRRRTSMLNLPDRIYEKYEDVYKKCRVCSMSVAPPPRAKISGIRASVFGDVIFVDHCEIELKKKKKYVVLLVLDGATNLLRATAQNSLDKKETLVHLREWNEQNNCIPKAIVGDEAFFSDEFNEYYKFHGIKALPCGPRTPWPNRAETAVRLFKRQWSLMTQSLEEDDRFNGVTIRQAVKMTVWARNTANH